MAITSIAGSAGNFVAAELIQTLTADLGKELSQPAPGAAPATDVAAVLLSQVATSDLARITRVLQPTTTVDENKILDTLLRKAIVEVATGNAERAIGYLADYAARDPHRAETLPLEPGLEEVGDKIDLMVNRMTLVAKMSAENGLSRAEQLTSQLTGKLVDWDTHSDVLMKLAHRLFESGGYANYSRTAELTRMLSDAAAARPVVQALAASAAASGATNQIPGVNVPYWASPDVTYVAPADNTFKSPRSGSSNRAIDDIRRNLTDLKEISAGALHQLWNRAPLLVMLLFWFAIGLVGGLAFVIAARIWPDSLFVSIGNFAFDLWGIGFLALVGFGFYVRVRYRPLH